MFVYLTSKAYPGRTADHNFVRNMARAFTRILGRDFLLVAARADEGAMAGINWKASGWGWGRGRIFWYALWLPVFVWRQRKEKNTFFSNDPYLLLLLIGWRRILPWKYKIVSDWHQMWRDWRDKMIARGSDRLVATSERLKKLLVKKTGVADERIVVAYGGVDLEKFKNQSASWRTKIKIREDLKLPTEGFLVGYVGGFKTMGMEKGIDCLIKAINKIKKSKIKMENDKVKLKNEKQNKQENLDQNENNKSIKLILVGGKEGEIEEYKKLEEREGILDRVIFRGWQSEEDLVKYEMVMDALAIPYPDEEHFRDWGFPMKVYEYMAAGRPIIYSDLEIMREVLKNCATSFKAGSAEDLAEKIKWVLTTGNAEAEKLAEVAREEAGKYTWEKRAGKIVLSTRPNGFIRASKVVSIMYGGNDPANRKYPSERMFIRAG